MLLKFGIFMGIVLVIAAVLIYGSIQNNKRIKEDKKMAKAFS